MRDTFDGFLANGRFASAVTWVQIALLVAVGFSIAMIPRLVPALFLLCGVVSTGYLLAAERARWHALIRQRLVLAMLAFSAYLFVNATWAADSSAAFSKAVMVALHFAAGVALIAYVSPLERPQARRLAQALFAGLALGAAALLLVLVVGQPLRIFFHTWFPFLTGDVTKDLVIQDGIITRVQPYRLNPNVGNLVIFLLPATLLARAIFTGARRALVLAMWIAAVVIGTLISQSDTAKVALGAGVFVFALAHVSAKAARWGLAAAWIATLALAVPLGALPHKLGWHEWTWVDKRSAAARFYIWRYTAEKVAERPLTGIGLRGTRELQRGFREQRQLSPSDRYLLRPGRHAHNGYLQVWLELGAIGAALVLIIGLLGLQVLARGPPPTMRAGFAVFAMLAVTAATGWGIWQTWLLASFVLVWPALFLNRRFLDSAHADALPFAG